MLLVRRFYQDCLDTVPFRCAIFFSPVSVYDPVVYQKRGEAKLLSGKVDDQYVVNIPAAVIYGKRDSRKHECEEFLASCNPTKLFTLVHERGHEIPGIGFRSDLTEAVKMVRRAIYTAEVLNEHGSR